MSGFINDDLQLKCWVLRYFNLYIMYSTKDTSCLKSILLFGEE